MSKNSETEITLEEWFSALADAGGKRDDGGFCTVVEIIERTGRSRGAVLKALKTANAGGQLERRAVKREDLSGRMQSVPGYKIRRNGGTR